MRIRTAFILLCCAWALAAQQPRRTLGEALGKKQPLLIQNATIHTITKGAFTGSISVVDGKIAEVGEKILAPAGAKIINASGKHVIPGMIDCHTHIAIDAINEGSVSVSSMTSVADVVNAEQRSIYYALAGGVTTGNVLHGSANAIGGLNTVLKMRWGKDAGGLVMAEAPPGIKFALGENPKRQGMAAQQGSQAARRYPGTRMGVEDVIRQAFIDARAYSFQWKSYEQSRAKGENVLPPRRDLKLEPLVEVLEGKRLVHAHSYRADEILMLLRLAEEFDFRIATLQHVLEGYKVAKEIAEHGAGASTFSDWWSYKVEAFDAIPHNAALLREKGVLVSINSDDASGAEIMRRLNTEAAKAVKYGGVSDNDALAMVTLNPAKQLGIDKYVGSIEPGKHADLVIYDGDPLSIYSRVEKVFIDGEQYFDRETDAMLRRELDAQKKGLLEKEKLDERQRTPARRPS